MGGGRHSVPQAQQRAGFGTVQALDADIVGNDQRAIQAAVDHVARLGGGTVRIKAGTYRLRNAVYLQSGVHLIGEGDKTLCLQLHPELACIVAFGLSRESELDAQIDKEEENALRRGESFNRQVRSSQLFGFLKVPFDDSGRFVLPPRFVKGANIADRLYFQGAGPEFLIFNPDELMKLDDADWRHAKLACEDLAEQAAAAAPALPPTVDGAPE